MGFHWEEPFNDGYDLNIWFDEEELEELLTDLIPVEIDLEVSNYPNPFNANTTISLTVNKAGMLNLVVTDISGRIVAELHNGYIQSGAHLFPLSAENLASGVYFYKASFENQTATGKALLIK